MAKEQPPTQTPPPYSGYPIQVMVSQPEEPINWHEYWRTLIEHKKLIVILTVTSTFLAFLASIIISPVYRAEVLLAPVIQEKTEGLSMLTGQFGDLAALAGLNLGTTGDKSSEYIAALKSRAMSIVFINAENLKPILFPGRWDIENKKWKDKVPTDWDAFRIFDKDIRVVSVDKKTGLVALSIDWKDPTLAANWANNLVARVNSRLQAEAIEEADKNVRYLEKQLTETSSVEVQQAIYRLVEAQTKKRMIASTQQQFAFRVIDPAMVPEEKIRPKRMLITALGLLMGLTLGIVISLTYRAFGIR
jgi:uncharacterized protein involved in exopolysaccharide biosynthesis